VKIVLICLMCVTVVDIHACENLQSLDWLLGDWKMDTEKTVVHESWHQVSNHTFEGKSFTSFNNSDQQSNIESMRLLHMSDGLYLLAKVPQNPLPVAFFAEECKNNSVLFVNPKHDFPQYLMYQLTTESELNVKVSSSSNPGFEMNYIRD